MARVSESIEIYESPRWWTKWWYSDHLRRIRTNEALNIEVEQPTKSIAEELNAFLYGADNITKLVKHMQRNEQLTCMHFFPQMLLLRSLVKFNVLYEKVFRLDAIWLQIEGIAVRLVMLGWCWLQRSATASMYTYPRGYTRSASMSWSAWWAVERANDVIQCSYRFNFEREKHGDSTVRLSKDV